MTPEELREIDHRVAEKVMGYVRVTCDNLNNVAMLWPDRSIIGKGSWREAPPEMPLYEHGTGSAPYYTIDIAAAVEVAERVAKLAWHLSKIPGRYRCQIVLAASLDKCFEVEADTAPLAICRAALKARGEAP